MEEHEPDYRFTFANERTFLAWVRTSLALDAAGMAVIGFLPPSEIPFVREALALSLLGLGTILAMAALRQWDRNRAALRRDMPLPPSALLHVLTGGVVIAACLGILIALTGTAS